MRHTRDVAIDVSERMATERHPNVRSTRERWQQAIIESVGDPVVLMQDMDDLAARHIDTAVPIAREAVVSRQSQNLNTPYGIGLRDQSLDVDCARVIVDHRNVHVLGP